MVGCQFRIFNTGFSKKQNKAKQKELGVSHYFPIEVVLDIFPECISMSIFTNPSVLCISYKLALGTTGLIVFRFEILSQIIS